MTKIKGLESIYKLRELSLRKMIFVLCGSDTREINKKYVKKVYSKSFNLYNSLTDLIRYLESIYQTKE